MIMSTVYLNNSNYDNNDIDNNNNNNTDNQVNQVETMQRLIADILVQFIILQDSFIIIIMYDDYCMRLYASFYTPNGECFPLNGIDMMISNYYYIGSSTRQVEWLRAGS